MIRTAQPEDLESTRAIFREYASSLPPGHICVQSFENEVLNLDRVYVVILLAFEESDLAGCVALRSLDGGHCEMKRLYVRPAWRGKGLGRRLVIEGITLARSIGFRAMRLDTLPAFTAAVELYKDLGFRRIPAYGNQPVELSCFELPLDTTL